MVLHIPLLKTESPRSEQSSDASRESWSQSRALMEDEGSDRAPFRKWVVDETAAPQCFYSWRKNQIPAERREGVWLQRRRHSPCGLLITISLAMDSVYYRFDGEQPYVYALSRLDRISGRSTRCSWTPIHVSFLPLCPFFVAFRPIEWSKSRKAHVISRSARTPWVPSSSG
jgi:hypothetical protein